MSSRVARQCPLFLHTVCPSRPVILLHLDLLADLMSFWSSRLPRDGAINLGDSCDLCHSPGTREGRRFQGQRSLAPGESRGVVLGPLQVRAPTFFLPRCLSVGDISVSFEHTWKPGQHSLPSPLCSQGQCLLSAPQNVGSRWDSFIGLAWGSPSGLCTSSASMSVPHLWLACVPWRHGRPSRVIHLCLDMGAVPLPNQIQQPCMLSPQLGHF